MHLRKGLQMFTSLNLHQRKQNNISVPVTNGQLHVVLIGTNGSSDPDEVEPPGSATALGRKLKSNEGTETGRLMTDASSANDSLRAAHARQAGARADGWTEGVGSKQASVSDGRGPAGRVAQSVPPN